MCVSTGPFAMPTHWKQTVYYLNTPLSVKKDEEVDGTVHFKLEGEDLAVSLFYRAKDTAEHGWYKLYVSYVIYVYPNELY